MGRVRGHQAAQCPIAPHLKHRPRRGEELGAAPGVLALVVVVRGDAAIVLVGVAASAGGDARPEALRLRMGLLLGLRLGLRLGLWMGCRMELLL